MPEEGQTISRRTALALIAAAGGGSATAALGVESGDGNLTGGDMALNEPYQAGERLWIGPDSARSQVDAKSGRVYIGASGDGYTFYNGDSGSWDTKGLGDSSNPIPSLTTDSLVNGVAGQNNTVSRVFGEHVESVTVSNSKDGELTAISSDYDVYLLHVQKLLPNNDGPTVGIQLSNDGGSSWITGASAYEWGQTQGSSGGSSFAAGETGDESIQLYNSVGNSPGKLLNGHVRIFHPADSGSQTYVTGQIVTVSSGGTFLAINLGGRYPTAETVDAVRVRAFGGGNEIASAELDFLGVMG